MDGQIDTFSKDDAHLFDPRMSGCGSGQKGNFNGGIAASLDASGPDSLDFESGNFDGGNAVKECLVVSTCNLLIMVVVMHHQNVQHIQMMTVFIHQTQMYENQNYLD